MPSNAHTVVTAEISRTMKNSALDVLGDQHAPERNRRQKIDLRGGAVEAERIPEADLAQQQQRVHADHGQIIGAEQDAGVRGRATSAASITRPNVNPIRNTSRNRGERTRKRISFSISAASGSENNGEGRSKERFQQCPGATWAARRRRRAASRIEGQSAGRTASGRTTPRPASTRAGFRPSPPSVALH